MYTHLSIHTTVNLTQTAIDAAKVDGVKANAVHVFSALQFVFEKTKLKTVLSYLHAALPADPQVSPGEETGHGMSGQVVDPALLSQLGHDSVNPGKTSPTLSPLSQCLWVLVPWDLEMYDTREKY